MFTACLGVEQFQKLYDQWLEIHMRSCITLQLILLRCFGWKSSIWFNPLIRKLFISQFSLFPVADNSLVPCQPEFHTRNISWSEYVHVVTISHIPSLPSAFKLNSLEQLEKHFIADVVGQHGEMLQGHSLGVVSVSTVTEISEWLLVMVAPAIPLLLATWVNFTKGFWSDCNFSITWYPSYKAPYLWD